MSETQAPEPTNPPPDEPSSPPAQAPSLAGRHLLWGWWALLCFLGLGSVLEAMHGFKVGWYLDVTNETRRLMWTLAHTHGTLLSLVQFAFAATLRWVTPQGRWPRIASPCLLAANVLLPGGFLLGGIVIYEGDPGLGVLLVPAGAGLLALGVLVTAIGVTRERGDG